MSLESRENVTGLFGHICHFARVVSRFVPFPKRCIAADENFQAGPPFRPHLEAACRRFKASFRPSREKTRERKHIEPDKVLRIVRAQPQSVFERRYGFGCASAEK